MMFHKEKYLQKLKKYAQENNIPIIKNKSLDFLLQIINQFKIQNILEIGTAIGYSTLSMSFENTQIDTLERDYLNYHLAKNFLQKTPFKINVIWTEALIYPINKLKKYDLIFIDAAKAQYKKIFVKFCSLLNPQGIIICDNLHLSCFRNEKNTAKQKGIFKKMQDFEIFLQNHPDFQTVFKNIDDGLSISYKITDKIKIN
ncbi:SAM-dependent methyltransferase [Candidatus Phytoplasma australiense]|uniref:SAM-dependent methyltransferase n=1 Tax=Phytoplasma australiense TaxID=59748 RepID=B1VA68_PHYAS|nr:SAM-dependent methyltransferase [Candidatus Phytoplasma australiense]